MRLIDVLRMSLGNLRRNKMRTFLTVTGVVVGIGAIVFLVSLGFGLQQLMVRQVANLDALTVITIRPNTEKDIIINDETIAKFQNLGEVSDVSPLLTYPGQIKTATEPVETILNGIIPKYFMLEDVKLENGSKQFSSENANEVIVSNSIYKNLGVTKASELFGKDLEIKIIQLDDSGNIKKGHEEDKLTLKVVGVSSDSKFSYVPLATLKKLDGEKYSSAKVKAAQRKQVTSVRKAIESMGYPTTSVKDTVDQIESAFVWVRTVLGGFGMIALFVAAIGIFNTMTISLLERTHEIGIMKAIGGRNRDVARIFTAEASVIGLMGGIFGVVSGWLLGKIINSLVNLLASSVGGTPSSFFYTPMYFVMVVIGFSFLVSTIAGIWPARRASKLNPLEALRYE